MAWALDHVTVAGRDLRRLSEAFRSVGLAPAYGGLHSNGVTHMAVVGFDDGSYVELISTVTPGEPSPIWDEHIRADAGPAAWALRTSDLEVEARRLDEAGVPVRGPTPWHRDLPDGRRAEWRLAFPGDGPPGNLLPFFIQDTTPRELRIRPSPSVSGTELTGIAEVVLGVHDLEGAAELLRRALGLEGLEGAETALGAGWGARLARFREPLGSGGIGVTLAAPAGEGWLSRRLARFGPCPCSFLLGSRDLEASARRLAAEAGESASSPSGVERGAWWDGPAVWVDPPRLGGSRLGVVSRS